MTKNDTDRLVSEIEDPELRDAVAGIVRNARGELKSDLGRARFDQARAHLSRLGSDELRVALREELDEAEGLGAVTDERLRILGTITTRDEAGRHFTERFDSIDFEALEAAGYLDIRRPIHQPTGIAYTQDHWTVEVTPAGQELVDEANERGFAWTRFESKHSDDEVFDTHGDGSKALYLDRDEDTGRLYLCDANDRWEVTSDEQIDADVSHWKSLWPDQDNEE